MRTVVSCFSKPRPNRWSCVVVYGSQAAWAFTGWYCCGLLLLSLATGWPQQSAPPILAVNPVMVQLDSTGNHRVTAVEIDAIAAGSSGLGAITNLSVEPGSFGFCDVGVQPITLKAVDSLGRITSQVGTVRVLAPVEPPHAVYVDASYSASCARVGFPSGASGPAHWVGFDAFATIQAAEAGVAPEGIVYVAAGTYVENVVIEKPMYLIGPNAGVPGEAATRRPEARVLPQRSDPENAPIISIESDGVVIDGFFLDGSNPALSGGYHAGDVLVHAAGGVQNGTYPDLADVEQVTIRNNIITNISYDGICLDRYQYYGTGSGWNYIRHNKLANMWEGILTYGLDSVIADNEITNATHGLSVHCVTTAAPKGFIPLVASNNLTIAQWWPIEIQATRAPGIWINFRREEASAIDVVGNIIRTPVQPPAFRTILGLYALTIDGQGRVRFVDNAIEGAGNCGIGLLAASCWSNRSVVVCGGALRGIRGTGVLADTLDSRWGPGNSFVTVSNVVLELEPGAVGVEAIQQSATPEAGCAITVTGNSRISGGACGILVRGTNASGKIMGSGQVIGGNDIGVYVDGGRALIEGNALTNNRAEAIRVEHNGTVDAGDCAGLNVTGLGAGSGPNGASAGLNDLSGYGPASDSWAIYNAGTVPVLADHNWFNLPPGQNIDDAIAGAVRFSESGTVAVSAPPALEVQCIGDVPPAATTVEEFVAAGGSLVGGTSATLQSQDVVVTNRPGQYTLTRRYILAGGCGQPAICDQIITARDDQPPVLHCSDNLVRGVDPGCDYATVTFTNLAVDSCGELLGPWVPVSTGRFPMGTNHMIVIATDLANNSSACSFDIAVIPLPVITRQPASRTNQPGTMASFRVTATSPAPLSFQWNRDGTALQDGPRVSGSRGPELILADVSAADAAEYTVQISDLAGAVLSDPARLTVASGAAALRIIGLDGNVVKLELRGPDGLRFGILTSTNLRDWAGWYTNLAPFLVDHTNAPWPSRRFYRPMPIPEK